MRSRLTMAVLLLVVAAGFAISFSGSKSFPQKEQNSLITNQYVLDEALPEEVSSYALTRIQRYVKTLDQQPANVTISSAGIRSLNGSYIFTLHDSDKVSATGDVAGEDKNALEVELRVKNYGNFFSISVLINGEKQDIS